MPSIPDEIRSAIERANATIREYEELELKLRCQIEALNVATGREIVILAKWVDTNRQLMIVKRVEYETALRIRKVPSEELDTIITLIRQVRETQEQVEHERRITADRQQGPVPA